MSHRIDRAWKPAPPGIEKARRRNMYPLALIGLPEIGYIIAIASVIFGVTAVLQNPFISKGQKGLWILTILALNWIGLLWYYYVFYFKDKQ